MAVRMVLVSALLCAVMMMSVPVAWGATPSDGQQPAAMVGNAKVWALLDMASTRTPDLFAGADPALLKKLMPEGKAPSATNAFLIEFEGKYILVDAGMGSVKEPRISKLRDALAATKIKPAQIDMVLLTHMHGDHVGGLLWDGKALFPKATIWVNKEERAFWMDKNGPSKMPERKANFELVRQALGKYPKKVKTFTHGDVIMPGVTAIVAAGHTPGHTVFLLESGKEQMLFWGDLVHAALVQFSNPEICAAFDMDKEKSIISRTAIMELAATQKIAVAGTHLPHPGIGRVTMIQEASFAYTPGLEKKP